MIDERIVERVRAAANVVDVIGDFYQLKKAGKVWECLCPFHGDRHLGSFKVSEAKNNFVCYACGAHGDSVEFLMRHEGLDYPGAIRWLGAKYGIAVDDGEVKAVSVQPTRMEAKKREEVPMATFPLEMVEKRMDLRADVLAGWLRSLPWNEEQRGRVDKVLKAYKVGRSKQGLSIFWQIDEEGRVRTGKMMRYRTDGHRDKESSYNFDWVHSSIERSGRRVDGEVKPTLFGLHLLKVARGAVVNIVESEKTALIMSIAYGGLMNHVWMACGGLHMLSAERLKPIIDEGRTIVLYPDKDGMADWEERARMIGYNKMKVASDFVVKSWSIEDGAKADVADIVVRLLTAGGKKGKVERLGEMIEKFPLLREAVEMFKLELV